MKGGKIYLLILTIIFSFIAGICNAEPDSTIKYLMDEPLSMLEWGMYRMNKSLDEIYGDKYNIDHDLTNIVRYDWDNNRIIINCIVGLYGRFEEKKQAQAACKNIVRKYRSTFGVNADTGKPVGFGTLYNLYFSHQGFKSPSMPKNINKDLNKIVEIRVQAYIKKDYLECIAPLLGKDIYFKE